MNARAPLLVGLVLFIAAGGMSWFLTQTNKDKFAEDATYAYQADFSDASGIRWKTRVQINGIDVGKIAKIEHVRSETSGRLVARVTLRIARDYAIYEDALLRKASESLLGDFRLELDPGTPNGHTPLADGALIKQVDSLSDIDEIKSQLVQVSRNVNKISDSFMRVVASPEGEGSLKSILTKVERSVDAIEKTTLSLRHNIADNEQAIGAIIENIGRVAAGLATISAPGKDLSDISHNMVSLTAKLDRLADGLGAMTTGQDASGVRDKDLRGSLKGSVEELNATMEHLSNISRKVDDGQGTLGRVVNDSGIADRVEATLDSANTIIGSVAGLETQIELRTSYDMPLKPNHNNQVQPAIKNALSLRIFPKPDKYYIIEAVADPRGLQSRTLTNSRIGLNNIETISSEETTIAFNALKFTAMFAKRYYFATMRFGIIESTGGLGFNLHGFDDRAELRIDAYDFSRRDPLTAETINPRLRATGLFQMVNHLHLQLGIDDPLNGNLATYFAGAVLRFTDEDLKALLVVAPKP